MKLLSALFASVGVALSTAALAADLPTRKEAPPPAPYVAPFTWTGFYIGGYAGGSFGSVDYSSQFFSGGTVTSGGFDIGGLAGFNYQFGGAWVVGAEAEFGAFINGNGNLNTSGVVGVNAFNLTDKFRDTGVGRLRGRVGYAVQPNTLLYIAGGWTFANTNEFDHRHLHHVRGTQHIQLFPKQMVERLEHRRRRRVRIDFQLDPPRRIYL